MRWVQMENFFFRILKILARYGMVCTSQSKATSFWVNATKLSCPLMSSIFCSRVNRSVKRNVKGMSDLSHWRHHLWKHPMPLGLKPKSCRFWSDLMTNLTIKLSVKPKKKLPVLQKFVSLKPWDWILYFTTVFRKLIHLCQMESPKLFHGSCS